MRPCLVVSVLLFFLASLALSQDIHVRADVPVHDVNPLLLGINTARWDESLFPGPVDEMLLTCDRDAIQKIRASGVTLLKYPGGNDADHYIWNAPGNSASEMDTDEYLALCREVGAEPFITVNFNESPQLAADWVRYCNRTRGYNVRLWEVGDEQWGSWAKGHTSPEAYAWKYVSFVKAMKEVDSTIKVATNVALSGGSPSLGGGSGGWTERVLRAAGDEIDLLTITFYPQQWGKENDDTLLASTAIYRRLFLALKAEVERVLGKERAARIAYVNVGYNSVNHSPGPQTLELVNALWVADMLGTMAETGTDIACYWAVHNAFPPRGGDYGYLSSEGSNTPSFSYYVFPMFRRDFHGTVVQVDARDPELSAYAALDGKKLGLMILNRNRAAAKTLRVALSGFAPQSSARLRILDGQRKDALLPALANVSDEFTVTVPPFSLLAIELLHRDSVSAPLNLAHLAAATASSYSTIGPHFKPASAIDGKMYTRWNSAAWTKSNGEEEQWYQLEWPAVRTVGSVIIQWGESPARDFLIKGSVDGSLWQTLSAMTGNAEAVSRFTFAPREIRLLRIEGTRGAKGISAYSIRELEVYAE